MKTDELYRSKLENRALADSELDAVTGAVADVRKGGAIIVYDYEGHPAKVTVPDIKLG